MCCWQAFFPSCGEKGGGGGGGGGAGEEVGERERESYVENVRDVF